MDETSAAAAHVGQARDAGAAERDPDRYVAELRRYATATREPVRLPDGRWFRP